MSKTSRTTAHDNGGDPPSTERPPFDPVAYAAATDSATGRRSNVPTVPPGPEYQQLRDSCAVPAASPVRADSDVAPSGDRFAAAREAPLDAIPQLAIARGDLAWFDLGDDASVLINAMNGDDSIETISTLCGVPPEIAQRIFGALARDGIVEFV